MAGAPGSLQAQLFTGKHRLFSCLTVDTGVSASALVNRSTVLNLSFLLFIGLPFYRVIK